MTLPPTVLHLRTKNDTNGNPRRFYAVFYGSKLSGLYEEGYTGYAVLPQAVRDANVAGPVLTLDITPSEYNRLRKLEQSLSE